MNSDVKIIFGTDAVAGAHGRNADELVARVSDAGQRPMDAIVSATSRAAEALGLDDQIGTAAPGFVADLVAVEGNPLENIEAIRNIRWVMKGGEVYRNEVEPVTPGRRSRRRGRQPE
jgi:imidazolonepropionase-like amidohydrolase